MKIRWMSEPLIHFAAIGLVIFLASRALAPEAEDPNLILVNAKVHQELADLFETDRGRRPTAAEMDELVDRYVMNETLVREARGLRLDHGDQMVRERLIQRMRLMMYSGIAVENPDDAVLRAWFETRRGDFSEPEILSFHVIGLDSEKAEAEQVLADVNARLAAGGELGPLDYNLVKLINRTRPQLVKLFGEAFVDQIAEAPQDRFAAVDSPRGWQLVRLIEHRAPVPASFEEAANAARAAWRQEQVQFEARAALEALMTQYPVERLPYATDVVAEEASKTAAMGAITQ